MPTMIKDRAKLPSARSSTSRLPAGACPRARARKASNAFITMLAWCMRSSDQLHVVRRSRSEDLDEPVSQRVRDRTESVLCACLRIRRGGGELRMRVAERWRAGGDQRHVLRREADAERLRLVDIGADATGVHVRHRDHHGLPQRRIHPMLHRDCPDVAPPRQDPEDARQPLPEPLRALSEAAEGLRIRCCDHATHACVFPSSARSDRGEDEPIRCLPETPSRRVARELGKIPRNGDPRLSAGTPHVDLGVQPGRVVERTRLDGDDLRVRRQLADDR